LVCACSQEKFWPGLMDCRLHWFCTRMLESGEELALVLYRRRLVSVEEFALVLHRRRVVSAHDPRGSHVWWKTTGGGWTPECYRPGQNLLDYPGFVLCL